jgi:Ca-activated chloride channel homolog
MAGPRALTLACVIAAGLASNTAWRVTAVAAASAQQPFRVRTDVVSVYATVTDRDGRLVPDLTRDDFDVRDNGKRQPLTFFSNGVQPITIVLMLDRSGSMEDNFALVQDAAGQFLARLLPADRARIGNFSRQIVMLPSEFTSDRDILMRVLHRELQGVGPSPVWTAVDRSITSLLGQTGRRVVLLFSDGHDDPMRGQVRTDLKDVIRRSEIDEVMIYAIGLTDSDASIASWALQNRIGRIRIGQSGRPRVIKPDKGLRQLADRSGGGYFELTWEQDLGAVFARVADELHRQYAMGFIPVRLDGKTHKLDVEVKRPDLRVRARQTYVAEPH